MKVVAVCTASREQEVIRRYCHFAVRNQVVPLAADCFWNDWGEGKQEEREDEQGKGRNGEETTVHNKEITRYSEESARQNSSAVPERTEVKSMDWGETLQIQKKVQESSNMQRDNQYKPGCTQKAEQNYTGCHQETKQDHAGCTQRAKQNHAKGNQKTEKQELKRAINCELLSRCDELWVFGTPISNSMKELIKASMHLKKPMLYFNHRCELLLDIIGLKGEF